jgi:hypothetical protein
MHIVQGITFVLLVALTILLFIIKQTAAGVIFVFAVLAYALLLALKVYILRAQAARYQQLPQYHGGMGLGLDLMGGGHPGVLGGGGGGRRPELEDGFDDDLANLGLFNNSWGAQINPTHLRLAMLDRDFTPNDYEVLCRLDEEMRAGTLTGIPQSQIERLPKFTYLPPSSSSTSSSSASSSSSSSPCAEEPHSPPSPASPTGASTSEASSSASTTTTEGSDASSSAKPKVDSALHLLSTTDQVSLLKHAAKSKRERSKKRRSHHPSHSHAQAAVPASFVSASSSLTATDEHLKCSICLEQIVYGDVLRSLPCLHRYHVDCVDRWLRTKAICPICKYSVNPSDFPASPQL